MKVVSFVEGVRFVAGQASFGLPGPVQMCHSLADRGHQVVLFVGGEVVPAHSRFVIPNTGFASQVSWEPHFGIRCYPGIGKWSFAPRLMHKSAGFVQDCDFVLLHSLYSFPVWVGSILARRYHKPYGIFLHGVLAPFQRSISWRKKWIYDNMIGRRILEGACVIFYTAPAERKETQDLGLTAPSVIIPLAVDPTEYECLPARGTFRAKFLSGHVGPLVLYLGRLNPKKGLDLLIQAMAHIVASKPETLLAIVGPSDPPAFVYQLKELIRASNLEANIVLTGPVTEMEIKKQAFADADVFALPSASENFGFAIFEAMASGVPVVISDALSFAGEVRRFDAGIVVRRDPQGIAAAILELVDDASLRKRIGDNGIRLARAYTWDGFSEKVIRAIHSVLLGQPLPADLVQNEPSA